MEEVEDCLKVNINGEKKAWLCKTCQGYLQRNKMPPTCHRNMLILVKEPVLEGLTKFENMLIARKIPFMYISLLPVSRMDALKGKVTLVPIQEEDIKATVLAHQRLPRTPQEAELVTYELKKKLEYRQTVGRPQLVNPKKMEQSLRILKEAGNPHYQIQYDGIGEYQIRCAEEDPQGCELVFPEVAEGAEEEQRSQEEDMALPSDEEEEETEEGNYDEREDPVRRNQMAPGENDTCMVQNNPEMERRIEDSVISVAPGEGRVPEGLLYAKDWDVQAYPRLHNPDGSQGLHQENRPVKLTDLQYFKQRLLHVDRKFAQDSSYLYAATIYQEKKQIRSNMNMSFTSGRKVTKEGGKVLYEHHDAWNVLSGIKNSPRFWRDKKAEVIAMMDNFGPFHWFFTLSCADKRWDSCIAAICRSFPDVEDIIYNKKGNHNMEIKVKLRDEEEEQLLEDFLKTLDESKNELIRKNVQMVTRYFDKRVKSFIKNIVMNPSNPMNIILYTYRVEFQKRGHAHVHGCLWMDIDKMEKQFPGLKSAFHSLRHNKPLKQAIHTTEDPRLKEVEALVNWIDEFNTCSLNKARVGEIAVQRAKEVQTHGHTRRCHKKGPDCG